MKNVYLYRDESTDEGTYGFLCVMVSFGNSLELPDRDNKSNIREYLKVNIKLLYVIQTGLKKNYIVYKTLKIEVIFLSMVQTLQVIQLKVFNLIYTVVLR